MRGTNVMDAYLLWRIRNRTSYSRSHEQWACHSKPLSTETVASPGCTTFHHRVTRVAWYYSSFFFPLGNYLMIFIFAMHGVNKTAHIHRPRSKKSTRTCSSWQNRNCSTQHRSGSLLRVAYMVSDSSPSWLSPRTSCFVVLRTPDHGSDPLVRYPITP